MKRFLKFNDEPDIKYTVSVKNGVYLVTFEHCLGVDTLKIDEDFDAKLTNHKGEVTEFKDGAIFFLADAIRMLNNAYPELLETDLYEYKKL
jgi:hypothetical protein